MLNDLYAYDINNAMWKQIVHSGISPPARAGHSGTALGVPPHLVIFGGANASRRFNDVSILDTVNNQWYKPTTRGKQPVPRYFHAAGLHRERGSEPRRTGLASLQHPRTDCATRAAAPRRARPRRAARPGARARARRPRARRALQALAEVADGDGAEGGARLRLARAIDRE